MNNSLTKNRLMKLAGLLKEDHRYMDEAEVAEEGSLNHGKSQLYDLAYSAMSDFAKENESKILDLITDDMKEELSSDISRNEEISYDHSKWEDPEIVLYLNNEAIYTLLTEKLASSTDPDSVSLAAAIEGSSSTEDFDTAESGLKEALEMWLIKNTTAIRDAFDQAMYDIQDDEEYSRDPDAYYGVSNSDFM